VPALGKPIVGQRALYPPRYNIRCSAAATGSPTPSKRVIHHRVGELLMMMENNRLSPGLAIPSLTPSVQTPELRRTRHLASHSVSSQGIACQKAGPAICRTLGRETVLRSGLHQQIVESPANDCNSVIICPGVIMTCITIYSPVLRTPQEGDNELQRVTMGYKPLWGKQPDHQHVSDFPRVADVSDNHQTLKNDA